MLLYMYIHFSFQFPISMNNFSTKYTVGLKGVSESSITSIKYNDDKQR